MSKKKEKRFEVVHEEKIKALSGVSVLRDTHTGVQYLYVAAGYGGGLSPLLDKDGKPVIEECETTTN
jgi:hypothetical protein